MARSLLGASRGVVVVAVCCHAALSCTVESSRTTGFATSVGSAGSETTEGATDATTGEDTVATADGSSGGSGVAASTEGSTSEATTSGSAGTDGTSTGAVAGCGDGEVGPGETCDDGDDDDTDDCPSTCVAATCGDGFVWAGMEECDDADADDTDDCLSTCVLATCGDGFVQAGVEECDDDNAIETDDCTNACTDAICGDGVVWNGNEQCDGGQGCADDCTLDLGAVRYVFATSQAYTGDMNGLLGADALCQGLADAANLGGTYMAWLATANESPSTRFTQSAVPYVLPDGTQVANDWNDLVDGSLDHAIDLNEQGGAPANNTTTCGGQVAWTNVTSAGASAGNGDCGAWDNSQAVSANWGLLTDASSLWTSYCGGGGAVCIWSAPIYCFQQS